MNSSVFELVLLLVIENNAFGINKIKDGDPPNGAVQELDDKLVHPFLK